MSKVANIVRVCIVDLRGRSPSKSNTRAKIFLNSPSRKHHLTHCVLNRETVLPRLPNWETASGANPCYMEVWRFIWQRNNRISTKTPVCQYYTMWKLLINVQIEIFSGFIVSDIAVRRWICNYFILCRCRVGSTETYFYRFLDFSGYRFWIVRFSYLQRSTF